LKIEVLLFVKKYIFLKDIQLMFNTVVFMLQQLGLVAAGMPAKFPTFFFFSI